MRVSLKEIGYATQPSPAQPEENFYNPFPLLFVKLGIYNLPDHCPSFFKHLCFGIIGMGFFNCDFKPKEKN